MCSGLLAFFVLHDLRAATFNIADGDVVGLRAAINTCNTNKQDDVINLAANGSYVLSDADPNSSDASSALSFGLDLNPGGSGHGVTINGNNATLRRSGSAFIRLINMNTGYASSTINNLTIRDGNVDPGTSPATAFDGGGVLVSGVVTFNNCTISHNNGFKGGGIAARSGQVLMNNCTVVQNNGYYGGGLHDKETPVVLKNCTFTANQGIRGEGLYNDSGKVDVLNCTFSNNDIYNHGTTSATEIRVGSTILRYSDLQNEVTQTAQGSFSGKITSVGFNLSTADSNVLILATDQPNADPKLDPAGLANNGGPTQTIALNSGSAIDKGYSFSLPTDQRGVARIIDNPAVANYGDGADVGAYEAPADPLQGSPIVVTTLADHNDGACTAADCTLREAIARAQQFTVQATINFAPGLTGVITLNSAAGGELILNHPFLQIYGPGARTIAISAATQSRVLSVLGGDISITGLTFRDGFVSSGQPSSSTVGGGIYNEVRLALNDCAIVHNRVLGGAATYNTSNDGGLARGGGIFNGGDLTLNRCTIGGADSNSANGASGGDGGEHPSDGEINYAGGKGGAGLGGAIYNDSNASLTINNCTIAGNTSGGGAGGKAFTGGAGGAAVAGIFNLKNMTATAVTISANTGFGGAGGRGQFTNNGAAGRAVGGIHTEGTGGAALANCIVAGNTRNQGGGADVDGAFTSSGFNLIGNSSSGSGFTGPSEQLGTPASPINPMLGAIQNNGGPTDTMALLTGSPALDQGKKFGLSGDQRGSQRTVDSAALSNAPGGDGTDIGAFEKLDVGPLASPTPGPTATATPTPTPTATPGSLANISTRLPVLGGDNVLIAGMIATSNVSKTVIIRAIGPTLTDFGVPGALPDPTLELFQGNTAVASNDDWRASSQQAEIQMSGLAPGKDAESAIIASLQPGQGYTAVVRGKNGDTGVGLVEVYDLDAGAASRLGNISTRGFVGVDDSVMIAGVIVGPADGNGLKVLVRALGPTLSDVGVPGALTNPTLDLVTTDGTVIRSNDDWRTSQEAAIAAAGLAPSHNEEAALIENLPPGQYTAVVRGAGRATGVGLVELYNIQ